MTWTRLMHTRNAPIIQMNGKLYRLIGKHRRLIGLHDLTDVRYLDGSPVEQPRAEAQSDLIGHPTDGSLAHPSRPLHRPTQKRPAASDGGHEGEP